MILKAVNIRRAGYFGYGKVKESEPFQATIEIEGSTGKIELTLDTAMSKRIVEIVADEVAKAGRATAEMMVSDALAHVETPALA